MSPLSTASWFNKWERLTLEARITFVVTHHDLCIQTGTDFYCVWPLAEGFLQTSSLPYKGSFMDISVNHGKRV